MLCGHRKQGMWRLRWLLSTGTGTGTGTVPVNRVERLIINLDTAMPLSCAWYDCDKRARTPYQIRVHEHLPHIRCSFVNATGGAYGRHMVYAFCSEGCKDLWLSCTGGAAHDTAARNQGRIHGQHSPGMKRTAW